MADYPYKLPFNKDDYFKLLDKKLSPAPSNPLLDKLSQAASRIKAGTIRYN